MTDINVRVEGLEELIRKCDPAILAAPLKRFFDRAAIGVTNLAKQKAPVDTGRLRASLTHETDSATPPMWAKVGTNVMYARFVEFGTGRMGDRAVPHGGGHHPPGAALDRWAELHGLRPKAGFLVARAISRRGGLAPRPFLRPALQDSLGQIAGFLRQAAAEIESAWGRR